MKRLVVIGGGIAGLAAAHAAQKHAAQSGETLAVTLLEREARWGGKIRTERLGGFVVEGGPDTFLRAKPWAVALCQELGLEGRLHGTNPENKKTYILRRGQLEPLPDGLTMMIPTEFSPMVRTGLLSWPEKARMGLDFLLPPQPCNGDESLGEFVSRRLGRAAYENLIEPLMSGIYAGDGDRLSLEATFPFLRDLELEHGGLIKGALALRRQRARSGALASGNRSIFLTPTTGLAEIVEALVERLGAGGAELRSGVAVQELRAAGGSDSAGPPHGFHVILEGGERLHADGVVLATPAFVSADLLAGLDPVLAAELRAIPYVSTATISLAYPESDLPRPLDGYGYVIPRREGRQALACTWTSTKFPHRAPQGFALLRVFVGRAGQEDQLPWDEGARQEESGSTGHSPLASHLTAIAREELRRTLGITAEPFFSRAFLWEQAMPQYNLGHPARLQRIESHLDHWPGLALAGNGYHGIGIPDCIHSGELAAKRVLAINPEHIGRV